MRCACCQSIEEQFDEDYVAEDLADYQENGSPRSTRLLIEALRGLGVGGLSLLDIGGGVGMIQEALWQAGARDITAVEASSAYLRAAQEQAEEQGYGEELRQHHGDFVAVAGELTPADIVTLDKVICCYAEMEALVRASAGLTKRYYGAIYPRDAWWIRLGDWLANVVRGWRGRDFRTYVHPVREIEALLAQHGLVRRYVAKDFFWQVAVYARE